MLGQPEFWEEEKSWLHVSLVVQTEVENTIVHS